MQLVAVGGAVGVAREPLVGRRLGDADHLAQRRELAIVGGGDDDVAILRRHRLIWVHARVGVPHPARHDATGREGRGLVDQTRHRRRQQVDLDVLAESRLASLVERREHSDETVQTGHHIEHRDASTQRRTVGLTGEAHQPRHGLGDEVVAGERGALRRSEPADREVDQTRVVALDVVVAKAEPVDAAGLEVLKSDVGSPQQRLRHREIVRILEVEHDRSLIAVDRQVVGGDAVLLRRRPGARVVTRWALHLDDRGTHVGQQHRAVRPRQHAGEVGHEDAIERSSSTRWVVRG